jgi:hypothetical protein
LFQFDKKKEFAGGIYKVRGIVILGRKTSSVRIRDFAGGISTKLWFRRTIAFLAEL